MKTFLLSLALVCLYVNVSAQNSYQRNPIKSAEGEIRLGSVENPTMKAIRIDNRSTIELDGRLSEMAWITAPVASGFTQRFPNDGNKPSERTEVRILYTNTEIFVGIMAYDSAPDSIMSSLFRRDGSEASDWVYVSFDSYNDKRTAFTFAVNPRGVQKDVLYYDDSNEDILWDAVWEAKTAMLENGWSAELRIPLSQLRFSSRDNIQSWGVNFQRRLSRNGEVSFWAPTSQDETGTVSKFGRLEGIRNLKEPRRLEVIPYLSGNLTRVPSANTTSPYVSRNELRGNIGGDIKYGLTSDLTLTATINPDFGQVEADPAVINLSAYESFFSERRPFFLEGNDIFQFGRTQTFSSFGNPLTFYSRRIGRSPQGSVDRAGIDAKYSDSPEFTTIAAAAKISGKTKSGWSLGFLDAYTLSENTTYTLQNGNEGNVTVEPATNYMVGRAKKDFNAGNTYVGGFGSAVNRSIDGTYFEDFLRTSAYLGGVDFEHNFANKNWVTSGVISYSVINGSKEAITKAQLAPARRYNRADADYLSVDVDRTTLTGVASEFSIQKRGGDDHWRTSITYSDVSPGYETNDIGFQNRADYRALNGGIVYRDSDPEWLQYYEQWLFTNQAVNYGGLRINNNFGTGGFMRFENLWSLNFNVNTNREQYLDRITRGGPVMKRPNDWSFNMNLNTNDNKKVSFHLGTYQRKDASGEFDNNVWAGITILPTTFIQLTLSPQFSYQNDTDQYVRAISDGLATHTYGSRYVFADIKQHSLSASIRLNWTFSPTMSLQTYVRPFIASGDYSNFKEFARPKSFDFYTYGKEKGEISQNANVYEVDPDGQGPAESFSFQNPDFNFRSVQGNAVFRWEYTPGSTLFLVWQQQRSDFVNQGNFNLGNDIQDLFSSKPTNVFLLKISYWFGS